MLLRNLALLLLCVSVAMCATLGHYQAQAKEVEEEKTVEEEEAPVVNPAALSDGAVAAASVDAAGEDVTAAPVEQEDDAPAAEKAEEILAVDQPAADNNEVDVLVADGAAAEEPGADSDVPAGDSNAVETLAEEALVEQTLTEETFAEEALVEESLPEKTPTEEALVKETLPEETLVEEALAEEAVTQKLPSPEEEGNEITPVETKRSLDTPSANEDKSSWGLHSIRNSFQTMHGYFDSLVELVGGQDGVCQYRCRYGETPRPRAGYQLPEPNGCSSSLVGFQVNEALDLGVPVMTKCCDQLDMCYDTCGTSKNDCDAVFRSCLLDICSDLRKSLGFVSQVQACDSMADVLHKTVGTLGCRPYMNSQRAACVCGDEERDEL
nr:PREDICTED: uncharacterized protein LOC109636125 isoform X1 [Paralichthys olivaceus]